MATVTTTRPTRFAKLSEIGEYTKTTQQQLRRLALNLDLATSVIQQTLAKNGSKKGLGQAVANFKARRAVRQYRRAAAHLDAAADCMGHGWRDIQEQFTELISPRQGRGGFDWRG